LAAIWAGPF
jgi:Chromo (CHRromatin Organisation MOdifier) domain